MHARTSTVARIGRTYPRHYAEPANARQRSLRRFGVAAGVVASVLALGLIGWFLAR